MYDDLYNDIIRDIRDGEEGFYTELNPSQPHPKEDIIDDIASFVITNAAIDAILDRE